MTNKVLCFISLFLLVACNTPQRPTPSSATQTAQPATTDAAWELREYAAAPADNPLKGFMPFYDAYGSSNAPIANDFPHSMEWFYIPLRNVMNGPNSFTFETGFEPQLQSITGRGHQAVLRIYVDYPSKPSGIPQYLLDGGLPVRPYTFFGNSLKSTDSVSPDYDDPRLVEALEQFIHEFGKRYDGDPRIAFVTLGLIGFWGEWHTWPMDGHTESGEPEENWMPSYETQARILTAYDEAFNATRLLMRYPMLPPNGQSATSGHFVKYGSMDFNIGYHDDSFAYNTLYGEDWYFMSRMSWSGGIDKWKTEVIGGELRPEIQLSVWSDPPTRSDMEDFNAAVDATHATWLIAHQLFVVKSVTSGSDIYDAALAGARHMGYEYYVSAVKLPDISVSEELQVAVRVENRGVAPFYYDWPVELAVFDGAKNKLAAFQPAWHLTNILPASAGESPYVEWTFGTAHQLKPGTYTLALHVANPLPNGKAFRFANAEQDADIDEWLTLGVFEVR